LPLSALFTNCGSLKRNMPSMEEALFIKGQNRAVCKVDDVLLFSLVVVNPNVRLPNESIYRPFLRITAFMNCVKPMVEALHRYSRAS